MDSEIASAFARLNEAIKTHLPARNECGTAAAKQLNEYADRCLAQARCYAGNEKSGSAQLSADAYRYLATLARHIARACEEDPEKTAGLHAFEICHRQFDNFLFEEPAMRQSDQLALV